MRAVSLLASGQNRASLHYVTEDCIIGCKHQTSRASIWQSKVRKGKGEKARYAETRRERDSCGTRAKRKRRRSRSESRRSQDALLQLM